MPKGKRIRIRGQSWKIVIGRLPMNMADGVCEPATRTIYISPNKAVNRKATLIHETLHAVFPDIEETVIAEAEDAIMAGLDILTRLG